MRLRATGVSQAYRHASLIWLMAALVLFAALAPTISKVIASNGAGAGGVWVEVCSASGTKLVRVESSDSLTDEPVGIEVAHCPFCLPQYQFRAPLALGFTPLTCPSSRALIVGLPTSEHFFAQAQWRPHRSRAPPAVS